MSSDPNTISLILNALQAGYQAIGSEVIKDAYHQLKTLLQQKLEGKQEAQMALSKYEENPDIWKSPLEDELTQLQLGQDAVIMTAAQSLQNLLQTQQPEVSHNVTHNTGTIYSTNVGNYNANTSTFYFEKDALKGA